MVKGKLVFVPSGGLANRMRAIASAYHLCKETYSQLEIIWFKDWGMRAGFADIFEPMFEDNVVLREANWADFLINDRPRKKNLWIPFLPQHLLYNDIIDEKMITPLKKLDFNFYEWLKGKCCYMSCYQIFGSWGGYNTTYKRLFNPTKKVLSKVDNYKSLFSDYTIGVHIRRTDNQESIEKSPTSRFVEICLKEREKHPELKIFLATDDNSENGVKQLFTRIFGDKLIMSSSIATRDSISGIQDGLAEMWTLSQTSQIFGSAGSSYSTMAAAIGNTKLTIVDESVSL